MTREPVGREKPATLRCPRCRSRLVIPVFYGYLCSLLSRVVESGQAKWGGVGADWDSPSASCLSCTHEWRTRKPWW